VYPEFGKSYWKYLVKEHFWSQARVAENTLFREIYSTNQELLEILPSGAVPEPGKCYWEYPLEGHF
jgi:hypothetical protein